MKSAHPFEERIKNIPASLVKLITKIDECKGQWISGVKLSPQILGRLKQSVLVTSTGASTRIEGARLSDDDVEKLMRGLKVEKFRERDQQEVKGYYDVLQTVFESWKHIPLNENTIKFFHREILKHVSKDELHRGEYKKRENTIHMVDENGKSLEVLFNTTAACLTPKEMQDLVEWTQTALKEEAYHPLLIVGNFLVEFLNIHPFQDGNGRLSRILTNLLLLKTGYAYTPYVSHEKLIEDNKPEYYVALRKSQKTLKTKRENILSWLDFFLSMVLKQSEMATALLSEENIEKLLSVKQISVLRFLQKVQEASPLEICKETKIARPTVNQVMDRLLTFKKVLRVGRGRSTRYRII